MQSDDLGAQLETAILETIRKSLQLHIGEVRYTYQDGRQVWRLSATSNAGEIWIGEDEDYYQAAVLLAECVGFDVTDG